MRSGGDFPGGHNLCNPLGDQTESVVVGKTAQLKMIFEFAECFVGVSGDP